LELAYWPHLDHAEDTQPMVYPLVAGIADFRLEYLARDGGWRDRWPLLGEADVPRAVRLNLTLADGARIDRWFVLR
jgi:type II secretion system protein J